MHLEEYIVFISVFPRKYGALDVFFGCDVFSVGIFLFSERSGSPKTKL